MQAFKMTLLHVLFALVSPYIVLSPPNADIHVHLHLGPPGHNKSESRQGLTPGAGKQFQSGYHLLRRLIHNTYSCRHISNGSWDEGILQQFWNYTHSGEFSGYGTF